jgi:hypothetical protein
MSVPRACLWLSLALLALSAAGRADAAARPPEPGSYCLKQDVEGLGSFRMEVRVRRTGSRYGLWFMNVMPDNPQILHAETDRARILADGSLTFAFTDGWFNRGRARFWPNGRVDLKVTKRAPENQIGRNYGTHFLSRAACSAPEFARQR